MAIVRTALKSLRRGTGILLPAYGVGATLIASSLNDSLPKAGVFLGAVLLGVVTYYLNTERRFRRIADKKLETICDDFIFPSLRSDFNSEISIDDPPEIRINVMILRHRDLVPLSERNLWPWEKSLQVDFTSGDYGDVHEDEVKWKSGEGVCGTVITEKRMITTPLEVSDRGEWNMTTEQYSATRHLGSLISIPIYADEDSDKSRPIGVLNIDSEENIDEAVLQDAAEELRNYANYIGLLA